MFLKNRNLVIAMSLFLGISNGMAYERIVSATGNASHILFELGLNDKLVAVDTTSLIPASVMKKKPKIGYRRALSAEGILSMRPDLLILAPDAGPDIVLSQLKASGIESIVIRNEKSIQGVIDDVNFIADKLSVKDSAKKLIDKIKQQQEQLTHVIKSYTRTPKIIFLMDSMQTQLIGLGKDSAGQSMIEILKAENVLGNQFEKFSTMTAESLAGLAADIIVVSSHNKKRMGSSEMVSSKADYPSLSLTKAAQNDCVFRISSADALGFGPNIADVAKKIAEKTSACLNKN